MAGPIRLRWSGAFVAESQRNFRDRDSASEWVSEHRYQRQFLIFPYAVPLRVNDHQMNAFNVPAKPYQILCPLFFTGAALLFLLKRCSPELKWRNMGQDSCPLLFPTHLPSCVPFLTPYPWPYLKQLSYPSAPSRNRTNSLRRLHSALLSRTPRSLNEISGSGRNEPAREGNDTQHFEPGNSWFSGSSITPRMAGKKN